MTAPPELRVVSGRPDDPELAAVVAVLLAAASRSSGSSPGGGHRSPWGDPTGLVRRGSTSPPGGWAGPRL